MKFGGPGLGSAVVMTALTSSIATALAQESLTGRWSGSYICGDRPAALELALEDLGNGQVWGKFSFSATAENPSWPSGIFYLYGIYREQDRRIELTPGPWIEQPRDFVSIGLVGDYTPQKYDPNTLTQSAPQLSGSVLMEGCSTFQVTRLHESSALGRIPQQIRTRLEATTVPPVSSMHTTGDQDRLRPFWGAWFGYRAEGGLSPRIWRTILVVDQSPRLVIESFCSGDLIPLGADGTSYEFQYEPKEGICPAGKAKLSITGYPHDKYDRKFVKFELLEFRMSLVLAEPIRFMDQPVRFLSNEYYNHFMYVDSDSNSPEAGTLHAVKLTMAELQQQGWTCLVSPGKSFARSERLNIVFSAAGFRSPRLYVVACEGQCEEISYAFESSANQWVTHFGNNYPAPVLSFGSGLLNVRRFGPVRMDQQSQPERETRVWVAELSRSSGDTGPGCDERLQ